MIVAKAEPNTDIAEIKENFWCFLNRTKRPPIKPGIKAMILIIPNIKNPK